jgi:hypothetical protein
LNLRRNTVRHACLGAGPWSDDAGSDATALGYDIREVGHRAKGLFNENNLIYTVKDEHGSPVGFAARDLLYEEKQQFYEKQVALLAKEFVNDEAGFKEAKAKLFRPRKYNNSAESEVLDGETRPKNTIYKKGTRLFNFDLAKKATPQSLPRRAPENQAPAALICTLKNGVP